ncbi:aerotaxis receptor [Robbsia andropogonis]|uniref:methyl-accepting chemotaxis protein n=1 Tax=Robbsia andropogonis TaxID=28092 RepID=UPI003D1A5B54
MHDSKLIAGQEYEISQNDMLVSATDLASNILYCNPAFIEASGYSSEELIGKPHNIIRHPDMPREAFGDMWQTIRSGKPWTSLVKNRRKNGDYYWICANVTPIVRDGTAIGYLSVRTKPSREDIKRAETLYRQMRLGQAKGFTIRSGEIKRTGPRRFIDAILDAKLAARMMAVAACFTVAVTSLRVTFPEAFDGAVGVITFVLCMLAASIPSLLMACRTGKQIALIEKAIRRLAAGDLAAAIPTSRNSDAKGILRGLVQLRVSLVAIVSDVRKQIDGVKLATGEIASGNMDLTTRTEMQAASLEESAASLEQLGATVKSNAESAKQANLIVEKAQMTINQGCESVKMTEETMRGIAARSEQITAIVSAIDSIAFQTNILALNAAVEAARAGEAGKGFAVVAGEVRNLSHRCAASAKEIKGIVESNSVAAKEGTASVETVSAQMASAAETMTNVLAKIKEVAMASQEQSFGIDAINSAVSQLDDATQQNAALVEQSAATAKSLSNQANVLDEAVRLFTLPT